MNRTKTHVRKGDTVQVITGDHKGSQGVILEVVRKKDHKDNIRVLVEGVNIIKKAVRPSQDRPQGGFLEREGLIHISNVKLVEKKK